jgi:hypothetical protein
MALLVRPLCSINASLNEPGQPADAGGQQHDTDAEIDCFHEVSRLPLESLDHARAFAGVCWKTRPPGLALVTQAGGTFRTLAGSLARPVSRGALVAHSGTKTGGYPQESATGRAP